MQTINISPIEKRGEVNKPRLMLLKSVAVVSVVLLLSGGIIYLIQSRSNIAKVPPKEQPIRGDGRRELITPKTPSKPPLVVTKKPQQPIIVEEGSEAWFCLKNNGGSSCLERDRFVPNHKIVAPPKPQKTYEDYLVQYGIRSGAGCGRWLNGKPHCI